MTNFEEIYMLSRPSQIAVSYPDNPEKNGVYDLTSSLAKIDNEARMQMQYRELDRQSRELEKELAIVKALRMELEKIKADFSISIEDEATKKIKEVLDGIDKLVK